MTGRRPSGSRNSLPFHAGRTSSAPGADGNSSRTLDAGSSTVKPSRSGPPSVTRIIQGLNGSTECTVTSRKRGGSRRVRGRVDGSLMRPQPCTRECQGGSVPAVGDRTAGRVLVLDGDGAVLLLHGCDPAHRERGSWWFTPGGGLDPGESAEDGARRELLEETGFAAVDLGPVVYRRTVEFEFENVSYRQRESFFCVRAPHFAVDGAGWSDVEVRSMLGHRWWTIAELRATGDAIHPPELADVLADLLSGGA